MEKNHILDQIRRVAAKFGRTPGRLAFENETGIKEHDWRGRHWARWSDAIREANLEPNQKTLAYKTAFLMEKFISLIREIGHFPTSSELALKANNDKNFPGAATFRRFGGKSQFAQQVIEYCQSKEDYAAIVEVCRSVARSAEVTDTAEETLKVGYVYLGKSGKFYKVGRSVAPGQRERQLAIQLPQRFTELHRISTDDPTGIEAYWHNRFAAKRTNGEFFLLDKSDVSAFKRRKFM